MKKITLICMFALLTFSCENEGADNRKCQISGYVQKGPFIQGSEVRIQELNTDLSATGKTFFTETNDDFGTFETNAEIGAGYIDIATTGFYFNEVKGRLSNSYITLKGIDYLSETKEININILTTLAFGRIKYLISNEEYSFVEARNKAQEEVLNVFNINIPDSTISSFEEMDISKSGLSNSILLAISSIMQYDNSEAELSELINKFSDDIKVDGVLNTESIKAAIKSNANNLDVDLIITNLENRYKELGLQISIPDFYNYIDTDSDSVIVIELHQTPKPVISPLSGRFDSSILVSITTQTEADIYYSINGTIPDSNSIKYAEPFPVGLDGKNVTVKAIAYAEGLNPSAISSNTYTFVYQNAFSPRYSILAGTYNNDLSLELFSGTNDVEIFYTTDGSTPNVNSDKYLAPISIEGDNTVLSINAIAIHKYLEPSIISSSYYKIDYDLNETDFITGLTLSDYDNKLVGKWIGHVSNPWTEPYNIQIEIFENGNYSARTLSSGNSNGYFNPAFYWGKDDNSDLKKIEIDYLSATGMANGSIIIFFDPTNTHTGSLKNVSFYNGFNNLKFEFWRGSLGPLTYNLTRLE